MKDFKKCTFNYFKIQIIIKARKNFLLNEYKSKAYSVEKVTADLADALKLTDEKLTKETDNDKKAMFTKMLEKVRASLEKYSVSKETDVTELIENSSDVLSTWLDKNEGHTITDNSIFNKLPRHFEGEFHKDMAALNVYF